MVMIKIIESKPKLNQLASNAMKPYRYSKNIDFSPLQSIFKVRVKVVCSESRIN
jgi:hypothetical protein